ncbi:MAG TPA: hypothetical protein GX701_07715 [Clostridiales bacterium]|nr:hypothetical protein [Clostridiales bacterium]
MVKRIKTELSGTKETNSPKEGLKVTVVMTPEKKTDYLDRMNGYIESLNQMPKEEARKASRQSLIKSGVLDKQGKPHLIVK